MQPRRTLFCYRALERALSKQSQMDVFMGLIEAKLSNGSDQIQNPFLNQEPAAKADEESIRRQVEKLSKMALLLRSHRPEIVYIHPMLGSDQISLSRGSIF